jgi:hypothetical protein
MLARFGLPERCRPIMPIPLITDTPLYLRGLYQYNGWSKWGALLAGSPSLPDGARPFREKRCAAKPGGAPLSSCAFRSRARQRRSMRSVVVPLLNC